MRLFSLLTLLLLTTPVFAQAIDTRGIYVPTQGAFGADNASLTFVDPGAGSASEILTDRVYTQGAQIIGDRLYLTAGNDGASRVDVIDLATNAQVAQVTGSLTELRNPRYLAEVAPGKAYVTNQTYAFSTTDPAFVSVLDLATNTITGSITVDRQPEGVAAAAGRAYVALGGFGERDSLAVIDVATDALAEYVDIGCPARLVFADNEDEIWAVCADEVVVLAAADGSEVARIAAPQPIAVGFAQEATYEPLTNTLLTVVAGGVLIFDTERNVLDGSAVITGDAAISAVALDPEGEVVYAGRPDIANPFSAAGTVTVHTIDGQQVASYPSGIYPTYAAAYVVTSVSNESDQPNAAPALAAYPNPFADAATVALTLDEAATVQLTVYDVLGRAVAHLADGPVAAGTQTFRFDGRGLPAGRYVARVVTGGTVQTLPLTLAR
ncbi:MAG: T9SS type A sorting domain-containing protein [Bacteroidota bacterium]